ncbi:nucleotide-diphospho-sugar transferase [Hyaloscypha finlandica]|nr:nucleotide-diphospho-sugar transferase [Hyaloscypha finlandica]
MRSFGGITLAPKSLYAIPAIILVLLWFRSNARGSFAPIPTKSPSRNGIPTNNYAFTAFLASSNEAADDNKDLYFVATRMMIYQLLHDPETRTNNSYPFVVLVTKDVSERKKNRLVKDGAEVIVVEKLSLEWAKVRKQWQDVLTKLRLFELVQFDKVLFLDSDTIITKRMDGIFDDPAAQSQKNLGDSSENKSPTDEGQQPSTYLFAGNAGSGGYDHVYPPPKGNNFNAGCMVFRPSKEMFEYYSRLAKIKDRFPGRTPEQSLWSYAHRRDGNMPWKQLHHDWNVNWATWDDKEHGIASLHSKFWELDHDKKLQEFAMKIRWEMEGYWKGVEKDLVSIQ